MASEQRYLPALGRLPVTALYDPLVALTSRERAFRRAVVAHAATPGAILDVGCGTGTLAIALAEAQPEATITGLDGDPEILERARRKASAHEIDFVAGRAEQLPFADASFDALTSTLVLHHLDTPTKRKALGEMARVLKPGGRLVIADWGRAADPLQAAAFLAIRLVDGFATTRDHAQGNLPRLLADAGLRDVTRADRWRTPVGTLELLSARR